MVGLNGPFFQLIFFAITEKTLASLVINNKINMFLIYSFIHKSSIMFIITWQQLIFIKKLGDNPGG